MCFVVKKGTKLRIATQPLYVLKQMYQRGSGIYESYMNKRPYKKDKVEKLNIFKKLAFLWLSLFGTDINKCGHHYHGLLGRMTQQAVKRGVTQGTLVLCRIPKGALYMEHGDDWEIDGVSTSLQVLIPITRTDYHNVVGNITRRSNETTQSYQTRLHEAFKGLGS